MNRLTSYVHLLLSSISALECYECGMGSVNKLSCVAERQYYQSEDGSKHVTGLGQGSWEGVSEDRLEKRVCRDEDGARCFVHYDPESSLPKVRGCTYSAGTISLDDFFRKEQANPKLKHYTVNLCNADLCNSSGSLSSNFVITALTLTFILKLLT